MTLRRYDELEDRFVDWLQSHMQSAVGPLFVGIDGRSGTGKSTLAAHACERLDDLVAIEGDQFYAGGSAATWDSRSVAERANNVIDWRRQRVVLQSLRQTGQASWRSFDWEAEDWDSDTVPLVDGTTEIAARAVVLLEGAYSCRPELHDMLDHRVLLNPPAELRRQQLLAREGEAYRNDWESRWAAAEDHYFGQVMPNHRFDLVLGA